MAIFKKTFKFKFQNVIKIVIFSILYIHTKNALKYRIFENYFKKIKF